MFDLATRAQKKQIGRVETQDPFLQDRARRWWRDAAARSSWCCATSRSRQRTPRSVLGLVARDCMRNRSLFPVFILYLITLPSQARDKCRESTQTRGPFCFIRWVADLGSNNGTFVNTERLSERKRASKRRALYVGDTLQIGTTVLSAAAAVAQERKMDPPPPPPQGGHRTASASDPNAAAAAAARAAGAGVGGSGAAAAAASGTFAINPRLGEHALALQARDVAWSQRCNGLFKQEPRQDQQQQQQRRRQQRQVRNTAGSKPKNVAAGRNAHGAATAGGGAASTSASIGQSGTRANATAATAHDDDASGALLGDSGGGRSIGIGGVGQEMLEKMVRTQNARAHTNERNHFQIQTHTHTHTHTRARVTFSGSICLRFHLRVWWQCRDCGIYRAGRVVAAWASPARAAPHPSRTIWQLLQLPAEF